MMNSYGFLTVKRLAVLNMHHVIRTIVATNLANLIYVEGRGHAGMVAWRGRKTEAGVPR
jgi:hypothetical protein